MTSLHCQKIIFNDTQLPNMQFYSLDLSEFPLSKLSPWYFEYSRLVISGSRVTVSILAKLTLNSPFKWIFVLENEFLRLYFPHKSYFIAKRQSWKFSKNRLADLQSFIRDCSLPDSCSRGLKTTRGWIWLIFIYVVF